MHKDRREGLNKYFYCLLAVLQLGIIHNTILTVKDGKQTNGFTYIRLVEALLESCPQSLFQLFVTLKNATTYSFK